jgi:hypothetical protein
MERLPVNYGQDGDFTDKMNEQHVGNIWMLPSGKHTKNYGKSPFSMAKSINGPWLQ